MSDTETRIFFKKTREGCDLEKNILLAINRTELRY